MSIYRIFHWVTAKIFRRILWLAINTLCHSRLQKKVLIYTHAPYFRSISWFFCYSTKDNIVIFIDIVADLTDKLLYIDLVSLVESIFKSYTFVSQPQENYLWTFLPWLPTILDYCALQSNRSFYFSFEVIIRSTHWPRHSVDTYFSWLLNQN